MDIYRVVKGPHITEKSSLQKELYNKIAFKVDKRANKVEIRHAVESLLKTKVLNVRIENMKGKERRMGRNVGKRPDWKKAIVTLAPGEAIDFFEGM
jgi:large subunit ribosomal protein L23